MAGYVPGQLPLNRSQEKEFVQAYEDVLERYKDERDRVQKKTFTKWVNKHLMKVRKHINDLYEDLRDGHNLISLLEVLSGIKLPREKGRMRFHRLQNVQIALDFLKQRQVKLVNIRNDDITDGNPKLTLGLIWTIILHFQISDIYISGESGDMSAKEKLLLWSQKVTAGYVGLKCTNFSSCWSDGKMFNAVIHRYRPDLVDMERVYIQSNRDNLEQAFEIAERLGVTRLLDAEDVDVPSPDEKSVITYVSSIYDAFPKVPEGGEGVSAPEVDTKWLEYQTCVETLLSWIKQHTIQMSDKSFPQNPVKLKALYNQYIHFKETEIPTKQLEKRSIEEIYKLLEVWIEFGRLKLPQGYHPNDVEDQWGKLIIEMLEREKLLRPAVERLELLLQRANKIQNGTLSCEEKLTLARNTLQADEAHLESGQPVQYESDVIMYLQECEGLLRQLQMDVQILREENYYQVEELVFKIVRLQDELVTLRLECTNLYRKGHFSSPSSLDLAQPSSLSTRHLKTEPLLKGTMAPPASTSWIRKPMTRVELVAISSSEDEGSLRFVYELLSWVEEIQMKLERSEWGNDLPSVEAQLEAQRQVHSSVESMGSSVKEARMYEGKMSSNFRASYTETLGKLETQYCKLMETSSFRLHHLQSLYDFVSQATTELIWLNEKEEEELAYDWSDSNSNLTTKKTYFSELTEELEEKQDVFRALQDSAELLSLENHPAKQTVEAYSAAVQAQWHWMKELCLCVDQHLRENTAYFQFFGDARESETFLKSLQDNIKRKYSCDRHTSLTRLEDLLQDSMDEKEQLVRSKSSVGSLVGRSKSIVQLKPRNPECPLKGTLSVKAACDYRQIEITIGRNDECVLKDNAQRTKWRVISPAGNEATVPSVCFVVPPPNREAIEMASRVEQLYQKVMSLWHQLHVNMKSLVSWNYLRKDIALVQSWNLEKLRALGPGESHHAMKTLQGHLEDFLEDSRDSEIFSLADRLHLEEEVDSCKENFQRLLQSIENEDKDETASRTFLSELKNIRLHLEECEQRLVGTIRTPSSTRTDGDALQENTFRVAEQERLKGDLHHLRVDLDQLAERCSLFLHKSPTGSSTPQLRSELDLLVEKMDQVYGLSAVYLDKLKMVDVIIQNTQGAESLVKGYEGKLSQEEAVPADVVAIQSHRVSLQHWISEVNTKTAVFATLEDDLARAKGAADQLYRLKQERSLDLDHYQEKRAQLWDRWQRVSLQMETRKSELENIEDVLRDYRDCHGALVRWIEQTTVQQERMKPGQAEDSRVLSEQLSQQMALFAEIEANQGNLDQCQTLSQQYSTSVKEYELQLMTYRAFVESQQKSPVKRRRVLSSSDAVTQEFMDLRTHYTALVTLTTQHVKYISDALRRLEEEEKVVEEEKQEHLDKVKGLLGWVTSFKQSPPSSSICPTKRKMLGDLEKSIVEQQGLNEELAAKKEEVSEAIKTAQIFLAKHDNKLSDQEKAQISVQLDALKETYHQLCCDSTEQLQQLQRHMAQEMAHQGSEAVAGVLDLGTMEVFSVPDAMQKGLLDQETGLVLLEAQVVTAGLMVPNARERLSLPEGLTTGIIDGKTFQRLEQVQEAVQMINNMPPQGSPFHPVVAAIETGVISEDTGLRMAQAQLLTGSFIHPSSHEQIGLEEALQKGLMTSHFHQALASRLNSCQEALADPDSAEKVTFDDLMRQCVAHPETGLKLLPVKQAPGGRASSQSGPDPCTLRAGPEGVAEEEGTRESLGGHCKVTVEEAGRDHLIEQEWAHDLLVRQLQTGGIVDTLAGERVSLQKAIEGGLVTSRLAVMVLESLRSFMGLVRPESGEVVPVRDSLEQGVLTSELADDILRGRQNIKALFKAETNELFPWKEAVDCGILSEDVAQTLQSTCLPDFIPEEGAPPDPSGNFQGKSSPPAQPAGPGEGKEGPRSSWEEEKRLLYLMSHSYVNIHNGERVLLVDGELSSLSGILVPAKQNGSSIDLLGASKTQPQERREGVGRGATIEDPGCHDEIIVEELSLNSPASENTQEQKPQPHISLPSKIIRLNIGDISELVNVKEEETVADLAGGLGGELGGSRREQGLVQMQNNSRVELQGFCKSDCERETRNEEVKLEKELSEEERTTLEEQGREAGGHEVRQRDLTADTLEKMGKPHILEKEVIAADRRPEATNWSSMGKVQNGSRDGLFIEAEGDPVDGHIERDQLATDKSVVPISPSATSVSPKPPAGGSALTLLLTQLQEGGVIHEPTGKKMLLDEAVACGAVPSHTAMKVMGEMEMFRGFFDAGTSESLTTEEVVSAGLMDENLLQKVLAADQAISGVIDPWSKSIHSIKEASEFGLLDTETATRILEAQVATGGIVDFKRGKKMSVTLASNLGLIPNSGQENLQKLEKAFKGKCAEETVKEKLIALQAEVGGVLDPKTREPLTVAQAVQRGRLSEEKAFGLLTKQIASGGILHHKTGMRLCVDDALEHELIDGNLYRDLRRAEEICLHRSIHPETNKPVSLPPAVSLGLISSDFQRKVQEIQASTGSIFDPGLGQNITLAEAVKKGLMSKPVMEQAAVSSEMKEAILYPGSCRLVPHSELVRRSKIDVESGHRYLEVLPFQEVKDEGTGKVLLGSQAVKRGRVDTTLALRLLQAQADTGGILETSTGQRLSLASALEKEVLDEETAKIIAVNQVRGGGIVSAVSGKRVTLTEATEKGLVTPKLASAIQAPDLVTHKWRHGLEGHKGPEPQRLPQTDAPKPGTLASHNCPGGEEPVVPPEATDSGTSAEAPTASLKASGEGEGEGPTSPSAVPTADSSFSRFLEENKPAPELAFMLDPVENLRVKTQKKNSKKKNKLRKKEFSKERLETQTNQEAEKLPEGTSPVDSSTMNGDQEQREKVFQPEENACGSRGLEIADRTPHVDSVEGQASRERSPATQQQKESGGGHLQGSAEIGSNKQADHKLLTDGRMELPSQGSELKAHELSTLESVDSKTTKKKKKAKKIKKQSSPSPAPSDTPTTRRTKVESIPSTAEPLWESPPGGATSPLKGGGGQSQDPQAGGKEQQHVGAEEESLAPKREAQKTRLDRDSSADATEEQTSLKKGEEPSSAEDQGPKHTEFFGPPESKSEDVQKEGKGLGDKLRSSSPVTSLITEETGVKEGLGKEDTLDRKELPTSSGGEESRPDGDIVGPGGQMLHDGEFPESKKEDSEKESEANRDVGNVAEEEKGPDVSTSTKAPLSKWLCLNLDERLVALLSRVRSIEMRLQRVQLAGRGLPALQEMLRQAEALDGELKDLSAPVTQDLGAVQGLVASSPREVPEQLLRALETDAKNLGKSFGSVRDALAAWLLDLRTAAGAGKAKTQARHGELRGELQGLLKWVAETTHQLNGLEPGAGTEAGCWTPHLQRCKELAKPLAEMEARLDEMASNVQLFISEHAQDLSTEQSGQLLRLLNALQRSFRELSERVTAHTEVLQTLQEQQALRDHKLQDMCAWMDRAEAQLQGSQAATAGASGEDLSILEHGQKDVTDLRRSLHGRAASFSSVLKAAEGFLEENRLQLPAGETAALQEKLRRAQGQYLSLQERVEAAQKELESAVTSVKQQQTEKVRAIKDFEENQRKVESLLQWVASVKKTRGATEGKLWSVENIGGRAQDVPDSHSLERVEENLDLHYTSLKAHHQELLSHQQDVILATQSAQGFLDKQSDSLTLEEKQRLQRGLEELKGQYAAALSQTEAQLKEAQTLWDELKKFLRDHQEFAAWLDQAEQDLEKMCAGDGALESLPPALLRQSSFSEDVISHKGDLRFVTMSGQKVLEAEKVVAAASGGEPSPEISATGTLVRSKLEDANRRYGTLHSKCAAVGLHLSLLLDRSQHFQDVAGSLRSWLQQSEEAVTRLLLEPISSDPAVLQRQLASAKHLQEDLAEHQVPVERLEEAARSLLEIREAPVPDHRGIQQTTDSIMSRFQSLSCRMAERSDLLQKSIAQSQSVQEALDSLLQAMAEIEEALQQGPLSAFSSMSIQEALSKNTKLKQDVARQKSSLEATGEMVTQFMETADSTTAAALQSKLAEVTQRFSHLWQQQQEKEDTWKKALPQVEQYEQLSERLKQFTESRGRMLALGNQPERDIAHFAQQVQDLNSELRQRQEDLEKLEHLTTELSSSGLLCSGPSSPQETVHSLRKEFTQLQRNAREREKGASSCQEQLDVFRKLVGSLRQWLEETGRKVPATETSLGTHELEKRRQQTEVFVEEWLSKGGLVEEMNQRGTALENLIVEITAPEAQPKTGPVLSAGGSATGSVNGYHTCKDLTQIQCDMSDVSQQYEALGAALRGRLAQLSAMLEKMRGVQEEVGSVLSWLQEKEQALEVLGASASPTQSETVRAQAEHNKAFLRELEQNAVKVQAAKESLSGLLEKYPDSPEARNWKRMLGELSSRWAHAKQVAEERQQKLEKSANELASFQEAEGQLRPWLVEKELMMSVLGPLSIDPNMLNAQKQQVQFMLKEFEARRHQHDQLNEAARGAPTSPGEKPPSHSRVQEELQAINGKWTKLTERLSSRASQIDQAVVKSTQLQELLQGLSGKVKVAGQRLSAQPAIGSQPEAVKQQLEETSGIRSELEQLEEEMAEAQALCDQLSGLIGEQYLKDELRKRLETVALPLKGLEDLAGDRLNRLQTALASSQQFQQMFDELHAWLEDRLKQQAQSGPISAKLERLQVQVQEQEEAQKSLNQHSGSYEMVVAEEASLLLLRPGQEKAALQGQLGSLKAKWGELSKQIGSRHSRLKDCVQKAQKYQRHAEDLLPWLEDCRSKMLELEVTLDLVQLEATLLRSRALLSDVAKRRSLLEVLNGAADILIEASEMDEDDIRDEKAEINQKMDTITEELQAKTEGLEEMSQRLKEFQESFRNIDKKLEGTKHQLEIYEALGPQACSTKNLEKLRAQQEALQALEAQVDYLRDFTRGLVQDTPDGSDSSHLLRQAEVVQQDFQGVRQKVNECCKIMESKLEGIGLFNNHVREMFSQLTDLDDELDGMGPVGRDMDSLQSQADHAHEFLGKLQRLRLDIQASEEKCRQLLDDEGSPDLLGLKRELETLSKQCLKLTERGKSRLEQVDTTLARVKDFYHKLKELNCMTTAAEDGEALQWVVGTEVDVINQQLADFKQFQKEQVDPLQSKLQQVNGLGQGLVQSAGKNCDVQGLEHDMEEINTRWNTLHKKVAQRVAQLQEALLHCGKFQDALEPLLSWLGDTEELISSQKPPSAEYKVVKAQIQEQKLLQRLLDDRKATVEMIQAEGGRIARSAEPADREKIAGQLNSLGSHWEGLLGKASARQSQLEEILVLARQFHETSEPIAEWLTVTEKKLANSEPIGTQTAKIQQQIARHKALEEEIDSQASVVTQVVSLGHSLALLSCCAEQATLAEKLDLLESRYAEVSDRCGRKAALLDQALSNARLFGEDEVEVLNWLAEVEDKLSLVSVKDYRREVLQQQHSGQLALNDEIVNRKKHVDQAIKNGQALLKQTTGEEVLLIQEKLDGIKTRYSDITAASSKALRTLEQACQLATKFQSTHEELTGWMGQVEEELMSGGGHSPTGEQIPQFQQRQKELKKEVMEHQIILDTVNEVSHALLELVPWRAREGLDKLVSDTNERYKATSDTINQRVAEIDAAIQRSQQYEQAADAELAWVAETRRKLLALGPVRLEQDQTTAQLQVQKAFSIDIIRHKDSVDELLSQRTEILGTCGEEQKVMLQEKTETLVKQYEATSLLHSERYARLERAQVLVSQFWETYEELSPWLEETQGLIGQLPPPAIDHEHLKQQQEDMRQLRESIAEHKPHIDKLLKIGPQLTELNPEEGAMVQGKYCAAEATYARIKEEVRRRAQALDEAISQSTQFHDKIEPMLETLETLSSRLRTPPLIPAEVEKIRECIGDNKNATLELEKLQPSFEGLKRRGEELIGRSRGADRDLAAKDIQDKLDQMVFFWEDIKARAEEREIKFLDVLELAEKFWYDMAALLTTIRDTQDIVHDLESPGIDPSIIKQQVEAAETIKEETDSLHEELEFIRILGADLIFACGETEKPEVKKSIDEMNGAWEQLNRTWRERLEKLEEAMQNAVQYQDNLQAMFDWLDNTVIKLCNMSTVGTDLDTVKEQLNEMKVFKTEVYQQQIEMEKLNHQGDLLLKKAADETDRDIIREPLTELKHLWENLSEKIAHRQHKLEGSLLALGQFQHALAELIAWLTHTEELLDAQRPISGDPKIIEVELAKHHVLKNDVLAHQATVETVNQAGNELLESSAGDDASSLRSRLETMNACWESVLQKTEVREQQLQTTLQQAQGFHGEIEDFLLWLTRMESQLLASKATGGLPETAREQLNAHMELHAQLKANEGVYSQILAKGRLMLLSQDDSGSGSKMEQSVALLEQKWVLVSTKMEERKSKLEEAVHLATEFQNALQDFINWLTLAEQGLNVASPPSLILATVLSQVEEHKGFANEVNAHRHQIIALDQSGNQLKFLSQKQDVVLIKNLLVSVQSRWEQVVQRSVERGRALDDARKRAKQFYEAWKKLVDWLEDAENNLNSELEISNDPDKIKLQLSKHKEFQKTLGGKQPVYDTTIRTGRALKDKAHFPDDTQSLDHLLGEVRDKWDTVCGKSVERQHKLEEALLFSGQFMDALQALVDWLYKVEPQLAEEQPVHGDLDLVMNLMDAHKVFQKELGKRTGTVQVLKRSGRELIENSRDDTTWVKVQLQELSNRWDTVCTMSVLKQTRLEQALKQAEEFRTAIHQLLEWLSEAEQTLRFRGALPDDAEALQSLIDVHKEFMKKVEEKRLDVNSAVGMGEAILSVCHPDCVTTIKHWITIIRARFEEVLTWAKQHQQRLEAALLELVANAELLEELLAWIQWAEATLTQRDQEPQDIEQVKALIAEHQAFMEEMTRKQPDVDRVTKTYKRKVTEPAHGPFMEKSRSNRKALSQAAPPPLPILSQSEAKNPRINQLSARWQQVWLLALERQRKLNDALDRLEELKEFANFDFDVWRKKYMRWMNHKKSRVMDFFRRIDKDQDGKITRQEFIDGILASKFPTTKLEMTAVADIFDRDGDGYIDYYEFVAALHPNKDAYRPTTDADKIEDEVTRQVAQCKCAKRFQVEQIGENKYRFFLGNQFGDSQQLRLVRILRSTVMVRVGGGWMALDEFLVKNDPCRARGRTNLELREKFILPEGASQGMAPFRSRGRRSKPSSRAASPTRSSSSASQSNHSCPSVPSSPATPASGAKTPHHFTRCYDKPWLVNSKAGPPLRGCDNADLHPSPSEVAPSTGSKLKRPTFHSSRTSLAGDTSNSSSPASSGAKTSRADPKKTASRPPSRAGSHAGSRTSSRRGSDASDFDLLETQSACSDTSESSATGGGQGGSRRGLAKPSKIPTMSKKASTAKSPGPKR
ncbi:microtubule-actin cross-linking factor 1 isoform X2 [Erythrolamprus reginae]|uniref:microtubule-actin cross-linking factor 1 isoform X2 n=1 Tax=Erythrolamprus reginae TaxID=121349 RepID=UPI00396C8B16